LLLESGPAIKNNDSIEFRKLELRVEGKEKPKVVYHYLYKEWPDFGVPKGKDLAAFFKLMEISKRHKGDDGKPGRIVHCSAGVGRSGTFIALEYLLMALDDGTLADPKRWEYADKYANNSANDPILETVQKLREQRTLMVQSLPQFQFVYHCMRKCWEAKYGANGLPGNHETVWQMIPRIFQESVGEKGDEDEDVFID